MISWATDKYCIVSPGGNTAENQQKYYSMLLYPKVATSPQFFAMQLVASQCTMCVNETEMQTKNCKIMNLSHVQCYINYSD